MTRLFPTRSLLPLVILAACATPAQAVDDPQWKLPPGFTIELVAGPPLVNHPTMGGFDDEGRLYICDGPGDNMPAKELLEKLPNNIRRLEDTDGDGKFDKSTMYADKMTFPMGALWHDGYVYTASPPHIWKLRDADGDGIAEERKVLVSEFGFTGNAADIHGCFLGPEGRIYWCDGRHGHTFTDEKGNTLSKGLAARIFSCKPDGTDVEAFAGGGMDNPVEICFTEEGEMLGTVAIFDNKPDRVDAIVHWVYGGCYPYYPKVLEEFKKTGDLLPAVSRFGRVAPSGILRYRGLNFGEEYKGNLFHAQFNTHRIVRTKLERSGATFKSTDEDFLVSENQDVHLTDVIEDADGSLLVVDTGGWFRIGCPNSQIAKPDILGGIYRIRRTDGGRVADARGLKLRWDEKTSNTTLLRRLKDERPAVQDRAKAEFVRRGKKDGATISEFLALNTGGVVPAVARDIVWTLAAIGGDEALNAIPYVESQDADNESVEQAKLRALAAHRAPMEEVYFDEHWKDLAVRRDYVTALGRMKGNAESLDVLPLAFDDVTPDRFLEHAVIYALIERKATTEARLMLEDENPTTRRAGLIALDQLGELAKPEAKAEVLALLDATDLPLQTAALGIVQKHPDWAPDVVKWLADHLGQDEKSTFKSTGLSPEHLALVKNTLVAYKSDKTIQELIGKALVDEELSVAMHRMLLEAIALCEFSDGQAPVEWEAGVAKQFESNDDELVRQAITTATTVFRRGTVRDPASKQLSLLVTSGLHGIGYDRKRSAGLRLAALKALGGADGEDVATIQFLHDRLRSAPDALDKLAAAEVLGGSQLSPAQRESLIEAIKQAGPLELPALLVQFEPFRKTEPRPGVTTTGFSMPGDEGKRLLAALAVSPGFDNLSASQLEKIAARYPPEVRDLAKPLLKRLNADLETQRARLTDLLAKIDGGDVSKGRTLFTLQKTACSSCHKAGPNGATIGPDLTKVGQIRSPADLLESVLFPSASFVRGYESVSVATNSGLERVGILSRETPEAIYLKTAQREEVRIPRAEIDTITPSKLSIMPQGLDKAMTLEELKDLIAYLRSLK